MTLNELRYIVAVARERHFGHAAEACFVSQPTLSVAVKKLEDELGVKLFERGKAEVTLTPVGERIVEQAQRVLEESDALRQLAQQGTDQLAGELRVGTIFTIGPYLLPHLLPTLHARAPQMPLLIEENYTAHLTEQLKQGDLDVIFISLPYAEPGIVTLPLYDEPFVVITPVDHPWTVREAVAPEDLSQENLLLLGAGHCLRDQVLKLCPAGQRSAPCGSTLKTIESTSLEAIRSMVASGAGVSVLPCSALPEHSDESALLARRPFAAPAQRRVGLAWRRSFPRPVAVETMRRAIIDSRLPCLNYIEA